MHDTAARVLARLELPPGDITHAALALADIIDHPDRPEHAVAAASALAALLHGLRAAYAPRSPLMQMLDAERAADHVDPRRQCRRRAVTYEP